MKPSMNSRDSSGIDKPRIAVGDRQFKRRLALGGQLVTTLIAAKEVSFPLLGGPWGRYVALSIVGVLILFGLCCIFIQCRSRVDPDTNPPSLSPDPALTQETQV